MIKHLRDMQKIIGLSPIRPTTVRRTDMVIYKTTNLVNGKIYVGKDAGNRKGYIGSGIVLKSAIKKYGKENFIKEILEECSESSINDRERFWIKFLEANNPKIGYNLSEGGDGGDLFTNNPRKEEIRNKIRERVSGKNNPMYGKHHSKEAKEKISKESRGRKASENTRKKLSEATKGSNNPMFGRSGSTNPNYGVEPTQEQKRTLSASLLKYWFLNSDRKTRMMGVLNPAKKPEVRKKLSEKRKNRVITKETRAKLSEIMRHKKNPNIGRAWSEEYKIKMSESLKASWVKRRLLLTKEVQMM